MRSQLLCRLKVVWVDIISMPCGEICLVYEVKIRSSDVIMEFHMMDALYCFCYVTCFCECGWSV